MIGVVVPAHDEAEHLDGTLAALQRAARHPGLQAERVDIVVVLDACSDGSAAIVARHGAAGLAIDARNVGRARAAGAERLLTGGARWLAFTDADTTVAPDWLVQQLALGADAVCGSIAIQDWGLHGRHAQALREDFETTYTDRDGHRHVHGANLGVSAAAYRRAGGFQPLASQEDIALVAALEQTGARIAWSAAPRVRTRARTRARARGGFGDAVMAVVRRLELQEHRA